MASLEQELLLFTTADGSSLNDKLASITVSDLTITNTMNGETVSEFIFATSANTLTNKSLSDTTCAFTDNADPTISVAIDASGTPGTRSTLQFSQVANRVYTVPDSGASCNIITTEGAQVINGAKTFTNLIASTSSIDTINESTLDHGVYVDGVRLRYDVLTLPGIVNLISVTPINAAATISCALIPKGSGAILVNAPDATAVGGNARGNNAVDMQFLRTLSTQVASGDWSVVAGGSNNTASAQFSSVNGGFVNTASGQFSTISGGTNNTASGQYTTVLGGDLCTATADYCISGGRRALSVNQGAFVIADSTNADFSSTLTNQFNSRYTNGYRVIGDPFSWNDTTLYTSSVTGTTTGAQTITLKSMVTTNNALHMYTVHIIASDNLGTSAAFVSSVKVTNVAGVLSVGAIFNNSSNIDVGLGAPTVTFDTLGTSVRVRATTTAAIIVVNWRGSVHENKLTF